MLLLDKTLLKLSRGLWGWMVLITGIKLVTLISITSFASTVSEFLGSIFDAEKTSVDAKSAVISAFFAALIMLISELARGELEFRCSAKARKLLRGTIFSKVLELAPGDVEKIGPTSAITSSVDAVESIIPYYSQYLPGLMYSIAAPVYLFFRIRRISLPIALILFIISILVLPANNYFRNRIEDLKSDYWNTMEDLTRYYLESIQSLTTLKLFRRDAERTEILRDKADRYNYKVMDVMKVNFSSFLVTEGMISFGIVTSVILACIYLMSGSFRLSSSLLILMLSYSFFDSIRTLMGSTHTALAGVSAAEKINRILETDTAYRYEPSTPSGGIKEGIELQNVNFSYSGRESSISNISLTVPKGSTVALAGLSGSGKSTVAGLMMRFFDPSSGHIYLDGKDYIACTPQELRKRIIMVPQSVYIFSGTLRDNLLIASPEASDEELIRVLDEVNLSSWFYSLPGGLDENLGNAGSRLSGGQRQKIGIARALLSNAEYIIFDESTSSVDRESENEIWRCIGELALSRTLIIISHRLSTIRDADMIYVLDSGKIAEHGDHDELMQLGGIYANLVAEQSSLEAGGVSDGK